VGKVEANLQVAPNRSRLGEPSPKVRSSQDRMPIEPLTQQKSGVRGKGSKLGKAMEATVRVAPNRRRLSEPSPKVRLSQDRCQQSFNINGKNLMSHCLAPTMRENDSWAL